MNRIPATTVSALLLLGGPVARADTSHALEDRQLQAALALEHETNKTAVLEAEVLSHQHRRAQRSDGTLALKLARGRQLPLADKTCPLENPKDCVSYRLVADLEGEHAYLVGVFYYEGGTLWLLDDRTGRKTELPAVPAFGPDRSEFITIDNNEAYSDELEISIWRRKGDTAVPVWRHGVRGDPVYHLTKVVAWRDPDRIELELWSPPLADQQERHWNGALVRKSGIWELTAEWPPS